MKGVIGISLSGFMDWGSSRIVRVRNQLYSTPHSVNTYREESNLNHCFCLKELECCLLLSSLAVIVKGAIPSILSPGLSNRIHAGTMLLPIHY